MQCLACGVQTGVMVVVDEPKSISEVPLGDDKVAPMVVLSITKRRVKPKNLEALRKANIERGKKTDQAILDALHRWSTSLASWGSMLNLKLSLEISGLTLSIDAVREHVLKLAQEGKLCVERQILDPRKRYKPGKKLSGFLYTYLVSLNGDKGERGITDFVITQFCDSYIERDDKGRFIGFF